MITLQEILDNLTYGELSHVAIGAAAIGHIEAKDYPKIVSCLNGALTALHKRFLLRTGEISVQQIESQTTYHIRNEYAVSNTDDPTVTKYVLDTEEDPFDEKSIFKIEKILNSERFPLKVNDGSISELRPLYNDSGMIVQQAPIYTPTFDTVTMNPSEPPEVVVIQFRADHPRILMTDTFNPELVKLHIPLSILDAISLNVASRIYTPLTSGEGQQSAASIYAYQYELECKRLEVEGMTIEDNTPASQFEMNGWA